MTLRTRAEWTEADGDVLWYQWPRGYRSPHGRPWIGSKSGPLWKLVGWDFHTGEVRLTHWLPLPCVSMTDLDPRMSPNDTRLAFTPATSEELDERQEHAREIEQELRAKRGHSFVSTEQILEAAAVLLESRCPEESTGLATGYREAIETLRGITLSEWED